MNAKKNYRRGNEKFSISRRLAKISIGKVERTKYLSKIIFAEAFRRYGRLLRVTRPPNGARN